MGLFLREVRARVFSDTMSSWGVGSFMAPRPTANLTDNALTMAQIQDRVFSFEYGNVRKILALAAAVQARGPAAGDSDQDSDSAQRTLEVHDYEYASGDTTAPPGVPVWCIYSLGTPTVTSFSYDKADMSGDPIPHKSLEGDATVHRQVKSHAVCRCCDCLYMGLFLRGCLCCQSLEVCTSWGQNTTVHRLADGVVHGSTSNNKEFLALLLSIASSMAEPEGGKYGVDCLGAPEATRLPRAECTTLPWRHSLCLRMGILLTRVCLQEWRHSASMLPAQGSARRVRAAALELVPRRSYRGGGPAWADCLTRL